MKKLLLIALVFIQWQMKGQSPITLTRADFPKPTSTSTLPDSVLYTNVVGANTTAQDVNGANISWIESGLSGNTQYQSFVPMSATPLVFQLTFLTCDYAQPLLNGAGLVGTGTVTDAYEYYNYASGDSRLEVKGFGANLLIPGQTVAVPIPALYSPADVLYRFPIAFGNTDSSNSGYDVTVPLGTFGNIQLKREQKRVNTVDAWGSLTTPAGVFDVLRVVSAIDRIDSVISPFISFGTPSKPIEYKWLASGLKIPALQINGNQTGVTFTPTNATFWGQSANAVNSFFMHGTSMVLAPNPALENSKLIFEISKPGTIAVQIISMNGQVVGYFNIEKKEAGKYEEYLPVQNLQKGIYQVNCTANGERLSSKLIKL